MLYERSSIICLQVFVLILLSLKSYIDFDFLCNLFNCNFEAYFQWQEFWVGNEELVDMYEKRLSDAGYLNFKLPRTNNRGDGVSISFFLFFFSVNNIFDVLVFEV